MNIIEKIFRKVGLKKGYKIYMSERFKQQYATLPPEAKKELEEVIRGLRTGKLDPVKIGTKVCGFCGNAMKLDHCDCASKLT